MTIFHSINLIILKFDRHDSVYSGIHNTLARYKHTAHKHTHKHTHKHKHTNTSTRAILI